MVPLGSKRPVECIVGHHMGQKYNVGCHMGQTGPVECVVRYYLGQKCVVGCHLGQRCVAGCHVGQKYVGGCHLGQKCVVGYHLGQKCFAGYHLGQKGPVAGGCSCTVASLADRRQLSSHRRHCQPTVAMVTQVNPSNTPRARSRLLFTLPTDRCAHASATQPANYGQSAAS